MEKAVLAYIEYLRSEITDRPQCFMFALLLKCKFEDAILLYDNNHFITQIEGICYDWDGMWINDTKAFAKFPESYGDNHIVNHYRAIKERFNQSIN